MWETFLLRKFEDREQFTEKSSFLSVTWIISFKFFVFSSLNDSQETGRKSSSISKEVKPFPMYKRWSCLKAILSVSDEAGKNQATDHMEMKAKLPFSWQPLAVYPGMRNEIMVGYWRKWLHYHQFIRWLTWYKRVIRFVFKCKEKYILVSQSQMTASSVICKNTALFWGREGRCYFPDHIVLKLLLENPRLLVQINYLLSLLKYHHW